MFLKTKTTKSIESYWEQVERLKNEIEQAEVIVLGAGAGLSTAAGFVYHGERFRQYFADFEAKYGFHDMYSGGFYPFATKEEFWGYWSRYIFINRYMDAPKPVYDNLFSLVKDKEYFVITTNVDHQFQKAGFDKQRLFYTQGDYGLFQCEVGCTKETYDNAEMVTKMMEAQVDGKIPTELLPTCPRCGRALTTNLRADSSFVEDSGWHLAANRYDAFIKANANKRVLYLELGVGYNTPVIIKYPFWGMTANNPKAFYACINLGEAGTHPKIENRSICINAGIAKVLHDLQKTKQLFPSLTENR